MNRLLPVCITWHDLIRQELGRWASEAEAGYILWNETGYPVFWNIPEDGPDPESCCRKQVREYARNAAAT
jgi:hypothetical protein